jgi:hypothetical protein
VDEPGRNFSDEEDERTPPLQYYLRHGYGPFSRLRCPPTRTRRTSPRRAMPPCRTFLPR